MLKSRNERILATKKINQKKAIRKGAGLLNTSIVMASLAIPSFSALASAEENASTSQRVIEAVIENSSVQETPTASDETVNDSSNSSSDTSNETESEDSSQKPEETTPPVKPEIPVKPEPEVPVTPEPPVTVPVTPTPAPITPAPIPVAPKVEVETTRPFTKEEVTSQNIAEVQVPEANHLEAEKIMFVKNQSTQEFIDKIAEPAAEIGAEKDLYASVMIAQAILESGSGNSSLSSEPNHNLFGIKGSFESQSVAMLTLEDDGSGNYYQITGEFRKYPSYKESLEDYAKLLTGGTSFNTSFYSGTWKSNTTSYKDATAFLTGKYATDTRYAEKLDQLIETYDLTQYDDGVVKKAEVETKEVIHTIASGDTLWDIGNTYHVSVQELMELNQLTSDLIFVSQELIIKKEVIEEPAVATPENLVAELPKPMSDFEQRQQGTLVFDNEMSDSDNAKTAVQEEYTVADGDSLYTISQKYKVSPLEIKHWNEMKNNLLFIGQTLTIHKV
ncbi:glucosaminidase domain-containing protein [Carnobacterium gallinarum]|uniref:glucosaminidase domain-containing protein n=1 Tax=Carnobacterium gallinarum TaxID=2749 RepID=UPI00054EF900|nr:glucosaminidase domain-containing protein [Carnobacterium gallinarum]